MIKQSFTPIGVAGTDKIILANILSKGAPSSFPLDGENIVGLTKDHKLYPGSTIYDSDNAEVYMLQEDYTWKKQ